MLCSSDELNIRDMNNITTINIADYVLRNNINGAPYISFQNILTGDILIEECMNDDGWSCMCYYSVIPNERVNEMTGTISDIQLADGLGFSDGFNLETYLFLNETGVTSFEVCPDWN